MSDIDNIIDLKADFRYAGAKRKALRNISGGIKRGKCVVFCGRSGCGKSTMLRCINHLIPDFYEGDLKGSCYVNGNNISRMKIGEVGQLASSVFQDPRSQFFTLNSSTEVAFGLENVGVDHDNMVKRVDGAFSELGLERLKNRNVFELSSGERQLVAVLSSWAMNTDVLLLDEPSANLDHTAVEHLSRLLSKLKAEGKTIVINEHRLYYLKGIADEYWHISDGEILKKYSSVEMEAISNEELAGMELRCFDLEKVRCCAPEVPDSGINNEIRAENIIYRYRGMKGGVLKGISFTATTGNVIGVIGSNGSGKTTLGKIISGLLRPDGGNMYYNGEDVRHKALQQESLFIMQEVEFQFFTNSVINELRYGKKCSEMLDEHIKQLLEEFDMWECRTQHPFSLSGGQMQKLVLMLAYLSEKPVVVLDEPTAGLDMRGLENCARLIEKMRNNKIVFIISHDLEFIAEACTRCISIVEGKVGSCFILSQEGEFERLHKFMETAFESEKEELKNQMKPRRFCDTRIKLLFVAVCVALSFVAELHEITMLFIAFTLINLYEGHTKNVLIIGIPYTIILCSYSLLVGSILEFIVYLLPRFLLLGGMLSSLIGADGGTRTIATLRKIHVPERILMVVSVIFRFLPVLSNDLKLMSQSVRTRGLFLTLRDKLKAAPEYFEILIVPLIFRVIRIAEALSASAETRGIELKNKKVSYIETKFGAADLVLGLAAAALMTVGFII